VFWFFFPSAFYLASTDICELIAFISMNFIRKGSPRSGQGARLGWMGVSSSVWGARWQGKGKPKGGKTHFGDLGGKEDAGTIGQGP